MANPDSDKGTTITRFSKRGAFTSIPNELLHHSELTGPAKLIWAYVWSRPTDWVVRRTDVVKMIGKDISKLAITRGFESLTKYGWALKMYVMQDNGKAGGCTYVFTDEPGAFGQATPTPLTYDKAKAKLAGNHVANEVLLHPSEEYMITLDTYRKMIENIGNEAITITNVMGKGNAQEQWVQYVSATMNGLFKFWRPEKHFKGGRGTLERLLAFYEPGKILRACTYLHKFGQPNPDKNGRKVKVSNWTEFESRFSDLLKEIERNPKVYRANAA